MNIQLSKVIIDNDGISQVFCTGLLNGIILFINVLGFQVRIARNRSLLIQNLKIKMQQSRFFSDTSSNSFVFPYYGKQHSYYNNLYKIGEIQKQRSFCVVVPTFNNQDNALINLQSILSQHYENYRVLIIDDASTDQTFSTLNNFIKSLPPSLQSKITLKRNLQRKYNLQNIYIAAHDFCNSHDIMTIVDDEDFLIGRQVFALFNSIYQHQNLWFAYSNSLMNGQIGFSGSYPQETYESRTFRLYPTFLIHSQVTFETQLFRKIKEQDLKNDKSEWLQTNYNEAIYLPMAQMAGKKMKYITAITYNDNVKQEQTQSRKVKENIFVIKRIKSYEELTQLN